jgi:hypothetical protein
MDSHFDAGLTLFQIMEINDGRRPDDLIDLIL